MPGTYFCFALSQSMSPGTAGQTPHRIRSTSAASQACLWLTAGLVRSGFLLCRRGQGHQPCAQATLPLPRDGAGTASGCTEPLPRGRSVSSALSEAVWTSSGNGSLTKIPTGAFWHTAVSRWARGRHHPTPSCLFPERGKLLHRLQGAQLYAAAAICLLILT